MGAVHLDADITGTGIDFAAGEDAGKFQFDIAGGRDQPEPSAGPLYGQFAASGEGDDVSGHIFRANIAALRFHRQVPGDR